MLGTVTLVFVILLSNVSLQVDLNSIVAGTTAPELYGTFTHCTDYMANIPLGSQSTQCPTTPHTTPRYFEFHLHL